MNFYGHFVLRKRERPVRGEGGMAPNPQRLQALAKMMPLWLLRAVGIKA